MSADSLRVDSNKHAIVCAHIIAPFDAASTVGGPAGSAFAWQAMLSDDHLTIHNRREWGLVIPSIVEWQVAHNSMKGSVPIILGGDHSLTYYALRGLRRRYDKISVVHFDAHHDRYDEPNFLTHYNVIRMIDEELGCEVVTIGQRHDRLPGKLALPGLSENPIYVTVDADFFDPALISAVADPRPVVEAEARRPDIDTFAELLSSICSRIVGADIVEWCGAAPGSAEFIAMAEIRAELAFRILESWHTDSRRKPEN